MTDTNVDRLYRRLPSGAAAIAVFVRLRRNRRPAAPSDLDELRAERANTTPFPTAAKLMQALSRRRRAG